MLEDSPVIARRVGFLMAGLGVAGAIGLSAAKSPWWGLSFLCGGAISAASFYLSHLVVRTLGPREPGQDPPTAASASLMGMRYVILGAAGYGMIRGLGLQPEAVVGGLLIAVAAVLAEILYELIHGT